MPSPSFTVRRAPYERHRSDAMRGRLVTGAAAYPSMSIIGPLVKCFDPDQERTVNGDTFEWVTSFSIACGAGLVLGRERG